MTVWVELIKHNRLKKGWIKCRYDPNHHLGRIAWGLFFVKDTGKKEKFIKIDSDFVKRITFISPNEGAS